MPYIKPDYRKHLDPAIDDLINRICEIATEASENCYTAPAGLLNYAVTRTALGVVKNLGGTRYHMIAMVTGVLHNVADEFYRRLAIPYEDLQITKNGDVDLFESNIRALDQSET